MHKTIGQKVPGMSEIEIEAKANKFRNLIGWLWPIRSVKIIEFILPRIFDQFDYRVMEDQTLGNDLARTWPDKMQMHISDSVYDGACMGDGTCNHVLAHELGHLVLHRNIDPSFALAKENPKYDCMFNSEWQADTFADYFLMPTIDVRATCMSIEDIQNRYCVPRVAAERHYLRVFGGSKNLDKEKIKNKGQGQLAFEFQTKG